MAHKDETNTGHLEWQRTERAAKKLRRVSKQRTDQRCKVCSQ